jgi:hypothetical protein
MNEHPALSNDRIEICEDNGWTEAILLNAPRTLRIATLGMWHASGGWVNDTPEGNERDVNDHALWLDGIAALATKLTEPNR